MGLVNVFKDIVEDKIMDGIGKKVTGNYKYFVNCRKCGRQIDTKKGFLAGGGLKCSQCEYIVCFECGERLLEVDVKQNPAMFKKGRREFYLRCPNCSKEIWRSEVEEFR
jgi:uncharacterized protein with PIN domain